MDMLKDTVLTGRKGKSNVLKAGFFHLLDPDPGKIPDPDQGVTN